MKINHQLLPIQNKIKHGNTKGIEFELSHLIKKASAFETPTNSKIEIYIEVIKGLRLLNHLAEAENFAEVALTFIAGGNLDYLSQINRLRALIALDRNNFKTSRQIIDQTDGIEMNLEKGTTHIVRNEQDIRTETWLIDCEIALAEGNYDLAKKSLKNAEKKLAEEQENHSKIRQSPLERQKNEEILEELNKSHKIFSSIIGIYEGEESWLRVLNNLLGSEMELNKGNVKNIAIESRLKCLLQKWSDVGTIPPGLSLPEARRWQDFGQFQKVESNEILRSVSMVENETVVKPESFENNLQSNTLDANTQILEKMTQVLSGITNILPNFSNVVGTNENINFGQRGFSGHIQDIDLQTFLYNFQNINFTGYFKLIWNPAHYHSLVIADQLPQVVESGNAILYIQNGVIIDVTFAGDFSDHNASKAQDYLLIIVRLTLKIGVDNIEPDIIGSAIPENSVSNRTPLLAVTYNELFMIASELEAKIAGIETDNPEIDLTNKFSSIFLTDEEMEKEIVNDPLLDANYENIVEEKVEELEEELLEI